MDESIQHDASRPRVFIETYGCQMNVADSELIGGVLRGAGYAAAAHPGDQRDVGDQSVHRAEDGGPQPAAGHVPVLVADLLGPILVGCGHEDILGKNAG